MQWPYVFAIPPEKVAQRRELLDAYARLAQTSILFLLLAVYLARTSYRISQRESQGAHPSKAGRWMGSRQWIRSRQRIAWWLDEKVAKGWDTRGELVLLGSWAIWLAVCIFAGTGNGEPSRSIRFS